MISLQAHTTWKGDSLPKTKDIYLAANDDNFTASAEATQAYVHNARMDTEFGKQISRKHAMMREKGLMKD